MSQQPAGSAGEDLGPEVTDRALTGPARALALVAAGLGLVVYLLGYVGEVSVTSSFGGPLLVAGGLLAGAAALPRIGRVLAPAAVVVTTGALLLLQLAIGIGGRPVVIAGTVVAFLETAAVVGAVLLESGVLTARGGHELPVFQPPTYSGYPPAVGSSGARPGEHGGYAPPAGYRYAGPPAIGAGSTGDPSVDGPPSPSESAGGSAAGPP